MILPSSASGSTSEIRRYSSRQSRSRAGPLDSSAPSSSTEYISTSRDPGTPRRSSQPHQALRQGPRAHHRLSTARVLPIPHGPSEVGHFFRMEPCMGARSRRSSDLERPHGAPRSSRGPRARTRCGMRPLHAMCG
jgi:hypothetical protein